MRTRRLSRTNLGLTHTHTHTHTQTLDSCIIRPITTSGTADALRGAPTLSSAGKLACAGAGADSGWRSAGRAAWDGCRCTGSRREGGLGAQNRSNRLQHALPGMEPWRRTLGATWGGRQAQAQNLQQVRAMAAVPATALPESAALPLDELTCTRLATSAALSAGTLHTVMRT